MSTQLLLLGAFVASMLLMSMNHKKRRKKIVFFGDSVTEQGTRFGGYIRLLQTILQDEGIDDDYQLVGAGIGGDKVYDLYMRMGEDILAKGADIVVIFIGINDVWHKYTVGTGTDIDQFESFYIAIIEKLVAAGIKVVVCTPAVIGEQPAFAGKEDADIDQYSELIRTLASQYTLPLVDIRKAFVDHLVAHNIDAKAFGVLTTDKVHLNYEGNRLVAEEIWKVLKHFNP